MKTFIYSIFCCVVAVLLCQCDSLQSDCQALAKREAQIALEPKGDYYIGRRYYIPSTRFWGYLRRPGESWRSARLVIMDESKVRNPDRGYEPPVKGAIFGRDSNVEYVIHGKFTDEKAYDPSTNMVLPVFMPTHFAVRNTKPGFLFIPSEQYHTQYLTLIPDIMPTPAQCSGVAR